MSAIEIKGLTVWAKHGVLPSEKVNEQPFVFDIFMDCDISAAALSDDVSDTVDYAQVCALVEKSCKKDCYNLIERLAAETANDILKAFPALNGVQVTVHKPQAPVPQVFGDVSVTFRVERTQVVLSLGSSVGNKKQALDYAVQRLSRTDGVEVQKVSSYIQTEPYGGVAKNSFLNCAVLLKTTLAPQSLLNLAHKIEEEFGRVRNVRWEDRTLDIDVVFFGNKVIEENGLCVPHPDYFNRDFVLEPLKEIVPDFVCPLTHKRISDM